MKKTMWKTTLREIKQSMGRFFAILAIVALGVGLFAGLKVTKPFMIKTTGDYLTEKNFYDFRLLSSYGFEEEDVAYLATQADVEAVRGSYTYDVLYEYGETGATYVMKVHSITPDINELEVVKGKLPENERECVVDSRLYGEEALGQTIRLSSENEEDTLENFAETEFKIVGIVKASSYIQFERGNTSLGTGKVNGFMYILPNAFDSEVYTEIYVKFKDDFPLYSEAYDTYVENKEEEWEEYLSLVADRRFQDVLKEANEELAEAETEFEEEKAEAEAELADAKTELEEAAQEIADAKQEIADGRQEIIDGYAEIKDKEKELADAEVTLRKEEEELPSKEQELQDGIEEWYAANKVVEESKAELNIVVAQLDAAGRELDAQQEQLSAQATQLDTQEAQLIAAYGQVPAEYAAAIAQGRLQIAAGQAQLDEAKKQLADGRMGVVEGERALADADKQLGEALEEIEDGKKQLADGKEEIAKAWKEIADGKQKLSDAKKELADAEIEIADAEEELADGEAEYLDGLKEYEDGVKEFEEEIADAETEIAEAKQEIEDLEEPDCYVLGRDTNVGYVCLESDSNIVEDVSDVFPVFFFLVAALVCMTTMKRMIEEQRTQIGVLKALGYGNGTIMFKYLFYSGSAALIGCIGGFFFGTYVFPKVIWTAYGMMYDVIPLSYSIDWDMAVIAIVVSMICSMGVTWYSCKMELFEVAASLMRPKAPKAGKRVFLEYIPFLWKRLKFLQKVSIRNVLRYKKRFFMMIIGISGCTALLVAGFGILDSIGDVIGMQYREIQLYDISVTFKDLPDEETLDDLEEKIAGRIASDAMFMETSLDIQVNGYTKSISLVVPQKTENIGDFIDLHTKEGDAIAFPKVGEVVITHKLAENMGVQVGDIVELVDEDHHTFTVKVSGINENFVYNYAFLHPDTCAQKWKEAEYKTIYMNLPEKDNVDVHQLSANIMSVDGISNVIVNQDEQNRFESMMTSMNYVVFVIILCAAALAFIVLYNLTNINITERIREIATIKVLGFYKKETSTYVFRENMMLTAIGGIVGLLLGKVFHAFVMSCINIELVAFDVRVNAISYVYSILLTFVFAGCVNGLMSGKLEKISMTESLKSVD